MIQLLAFYFFALNSMPKTNLSLLHYPFFNFSFSFLRCMSWLSSMLTYMILLGPVLECHSQMCYLYIYTYFALDPTFFKHILAHSSNPKCILMSLLIAFTILFHSPNRPHFYIVVSGHSYTITDLFFLSFVYSISNISSVQLVC